jgi:hypothetical protein
VRISEVTRNGDISWRVFEHLLHLIYETAVLKFLQEILFSIKELFYKVFFSPIFVHNFFVCFSLPPRCTSKTSLDFYESLNIFKQSIINFGSLLLFLLAPSALRRYLHNNRKTSSTNLFYLFNTLPELKLSAPSRRPNPRNNPRINHPPLVKANRAIISPVPKRTRTFYPRTRKKVIKAEAPSARWLR